MKCFDKRVVKAVISKQEVKGFKHRVCEKRGHSQTDIESYIQSPKPKSGLDFLAYLHELGHCKSKQPNFYSAVNCNKVVDCQYLKCTRYAWNNDRIICEYNAWKWALKFYRRLGFNLTKKHKEMIQGYFGNYCFFAENTQVAEKYAKMLNDSFNIGVRADKYNEGY
ncbi:hypothetical protein D3C85_474620 [compost metagenome]